MVEWPYRTTLGYHDARGWEFIELCEKIFPMSDRSAPISGKYARLLTILSKTVMSVDAFGMVVSEPMVSESATSHASCSAVQHVPTPDTARTDADVQPEIEQSSQPALPGLCLRQLTLSQTCHQ